MKKAVIIILTVIIGLLVYDREMNHYSMNGVVYEREGNVLVLLDDTDNLWEITDDAKAFEIGDKIKIEFNTNGTDTERTDDIITAIIKQ